MLYEDENKMVIGELWHEHEEDDPTIECALCGAEVDEETTMYGICEKCWTDAHTFDNALIYGASERGKQSVKINGLYAKLLTPDQINEALQIMVVSSMLSDLNFIIKTYVDFLRDDDGDFADWLKEQKNID